MEVVEQTLEKINNENKKYNAFITISSEKALKSARDLEDELMKGKIRGPLHGIPVAVKDLIYTKGIRTTMGSKVYENFVPNVDATVIRKLKRAGAVIIGKTHTHEFAYGTIGDRSYFGPCYNPYNPEKITGGSSSGSAAAVAAGLVSAALGTDTSGSVRIPSSACGTVGMKPTFGLVSKSNVFPLAYTLDHIGPMTKNVQDNALLLNIIAGYDPEDPYSTDVKTEDYSARIGMDIRGKAVGIPTDDYFAPFEEEIKTAVEECLQQLENLGATVKKVNLPVIEEIAVAQTVTLTSEAAAVHAEKFKEYKGMIDDEVYERLKTSQNTKGYEYVAVQRNKRNLINQFNRIFEDVDILLIPTLPILPTNIGQREVNINNKKIKVRESLLKLTAPTNFTGNPSLSIPCKFSKNGLPIGVQLVGKHYHEAILYQFAHVLEEAMMFSRKAKALKNKFPIE